MTERLLYSIIIILAGVSCTKITDETNSSYRPKVYRSVLDLQPRIAAISFGNGYFAAFDTEHCHFTQIWKGGIHWEGAPHTGVKNIQPTSWGEIFYKKDFSLIEIQPEGDRNIRFRGYVLMNNGVRIRYRIEISDHEYLDVEENVELDFDSKLPVLQRTVFVRPENTDRHVLMEDPLTGKMVSIDNKKVFRHPLSTQVESIPFSDPGDQPSIGKLWFDKSGCGTCHEPDRREIGPSLMDIANRYDATQSNIDTLTKKVKYGGSGNWGDVPMIAHPAYTEEEIALMVEYILSLSENSDEQDENGTEGEDEEDYPSALKAPVAPEQPAWPEIPGFGMSLVDIHPSFDLSVIRRSDFQPKVGAMDFLPDGSLLIATWDSLGAIYKLNGVESGDTSRITIKQIAEGLDEPLGMKVVDGQVYVVQKQELTQLIDHNGDELIDEYRNVSNRWEVSADFHEFAFGLEHREDHFYLTLSLAMRLMEQERQKAERGTVLRIDPNDGSYDALCHGLRTPNGISFVGEDHLLVTDNQGQWLPANKLINIQKGKFYGNRDVLKDAGIDIEEAPPAVWIPQDEIGNSPSEPLEMIHGPYAGQVLFGDVTHGGIKRAYLEEVNGQLQGCVFRFSQGLEAGINRLTYGPDNALYAGGVGMSGSWAWKNKTYGLQRLVYNGHNTFEILKVGIIPGGLSVTFTKPLAADFGEKPDDYQIKQWWYLPTSDYGGPKMDPETLKVERAMISEDRSAIRLYLAGIKPKHVLHLRLHQDRFKSTDGERLWTGETWYTANEIPQ